MATCTKGNWNNDLYAVDEQKNGSNKKVHDTDGDVQTWCILDERAPEQWQKVVTCTQCGSAALSDVGAVPRHVLVI